MTIRAGPRHAPGGGRRASRNDALPVHCSSHASHGGTPHPGGGQRKQKNSGGGEWDREAAITLSTAQGCTARRQSWLSTGCRGSRLLTGTSWSRMGKGVPAGGQGLLTDPPLLPRPAPEPRSSKGKRRGPTLRSTTGEKARGLGGEPFITRFGDRRGEIEILFPFLSLFLAPPLPRFATQRSRVAFKWPCDKEIATRPGQHWPALSEGQRSASRLSLEPARRSRPPQAPFPSGFSREESRPGATEQQEKSPNQAGGGVFGGAEPGEGKEMSSRLYLKASERPPIGQSPRLSGGDALPRRSSPSPSPAANLSSPAFRSGSHHRGRSLERGVGEGWGSGGGVK